MSLPTQHMAALRLAMPPDDRNREESSHLSGNGTISIRRQSESFFFGFELFVAESFLVSLLLSLLPDAASLSSLAAFL